MRCTKYIGIFKTAFARYQAQTDRPGYAPTLFTWFRHSGRMYPALQQFQAELNACHSDDDQEKVIISWLNNPALKNNNHSFRSYLVDVLSEHDDKWMKFDNKPLVFYDRKKINNSYLYRGSLQSPEDAFQNGMKPLFQSKDVEDYVRPLDHAGLSTSLNPRVANNYTCALRMNHYGVHELYGFLYQIHYRGNKAINIDATRAARHFATPERSKYEMNIIDSISREDIVGYGCYENGKYIESKRNPYYQTRKEYEEIQSKQEVLKTVFSR